MSAVLSGLSHTPEITVFGVALALLEILTISNFIHGNENHTQ